MHATSDGKEVLHGDERVQSGERTTARTIGQCVRSDAHVPVECETGGRDAAAR